MSQEHYEQIDPTDDASPGRSDGEQLSFELDEISAAVRSHVLRDQDGHGGGEREDPFQADLAAVHGSAASEQSGTCRRCVCRRCAPVVWWRRRVTLRGTAAIVGCALAVLTPVQLTVLTFQLGMRHGSVAPVVLERDERSALLDAQAVYDAASPAVVTLLSPAGSTGTGFFISPTVVVTNAHVISPPAETRGALRRVVEAVKVRLADGQLIEGTVVGVDERLDVAVVRVAAQRSISPLAFAPAASVRTGMPVALIGSPFELIGSISTGIVSAAARNSSLSSDPVQSNLLQIDAPVNPGNSGGPVLDANGRVLGMVTLRPDALEGRPVLGVAFALPTQSVQRSLRDLLAGRPVRYVRIGVLGRSAHAGDAVRAGAVVESVAKDTPAAAAGLRQGDVIVAFDGVKVTSYEQLIDLVRERQVGDVVALTVLRAGQSVPVELTLTERPDGS